MLPLDVVFIFLIGIATILVVIYTFSPLRSKIINFFISNIENQELKLEDCKTIFLENYKNLDNLCNLCNKLGEKIKKSCICYVVYSDEIVADECKIKCNITNNKIWLVKFFVNEGISKIIC